MSEPTSACDPCQRPEDEASAPTNRPGLPAIAWRIATQPVFLRRMLARLPTVTVPPGTPGAPRPLATLNARAADDPAIALLDAWGCVADVLTFYQERIANEGFLRTATERVSALQLARAIGYELSPGVAAAAHLAFNVEQATGAPRIVDVPVGTRVQSVPGAGQLPQTFEVVEEIVARPEWNALRPRSAQPLVLAIDKAKGKLLLKGLDGEYADAKELVLDGLATGVRAGDLLVVEVGQQALTLTALKVSTDNLARTTTVAIAADGWRPALPAPADPAPVTTGQIALAPQTLDAAYVKDQIMGKVWDEQSLASLIGIQRWDPDDVLALVDKVLADAGPGSGEVVALRQRSGFFGASAPPWSATQPPATGGGGIIYQVDSLQQAQPQPQHYIATNPADWDANGGRTIWESGGGKPYADLPGGASVFLERVVPEVLPGSLVAFRAATGRAEVFRVKDVVELVQVDFASSGRATGLLLEDLAGAAVTSGSSEFHFRTTTAGVLGEDLPLAMLPVDDPLADGAQPVRTLQLGSMVLGLVPGRTVIVRGNELSGDGSDAQVARAEAAELSAVIHQGGFTTLYFKQRLQFRYVRNSVTINANVARATHGETVLDEVLGGGDGTSTNQRFALKRPPLTYVSSPTASGTRSTLSVRVGGLEWQEQRSLYGLPPDSPSYTVRQDGDGRAIVVFGDGVSGARLPTGAGNVTATYRTGIGLDGEVDAGALSLLLTRPYGVKDVSNPLPADGAQAPEELADAQQNAPLAVLTLDRIVSLRDFEDFTRAFAGIGKAQAVPLWSGQKRLVHITIASSSGKPVDEASDLFKNVGAAIAAASDGTQELRVNSFVPRLFRLAADLFLADGYDGPTVQAAVAAALSGAFSFARRSFGQRVTAAEIVAAIQGIAGVRACMLTSLAFASAGGGQGDSATDGILAAQLARLDADGITILPAELLLLSQDGVSLQLRDDR